MDAISIGSYLAELGPGALTVFGIAAALVGAARGTRGSSWPGVTVAVLSATLGLLLHFGVEPLALFWASGGPGMSIVFAFGVYGLGAAVAVAHRGSSRAAVAALACAAAGPVVAVLVVGFTMPLIAAGVARASEPDRGYLQLASEFELHHVVDLALICSLAVTASLLFVARRSLWPAPAPAR